MAPISTPTILLETTHSNRKVRYHISSRSSIRQVPKRTSIHVNFVSSACWPIEVLAYRGVGLSRCWPIEVLAYRGVGPSTHWTVDVFAFDHLSSRKCTSMIKRWSMRALHPKHQTTASTTLYHMETKVLLACFVFIDQPWHALLCAPQEKKKEKRSPYMTRPATTINPAQI